MSNSTDKGYPSIIRVQRGNHGIPCCSPSDFFTNNGRKWEQSFFCLNCERRLYPARAKGAYLCQQLLCPQCLKVWIEKKLILLAVGNIAGVADYQTKFADLKKYNFRMQVYRETYR